MNISFNALKYDVTSWTFSKLQNKRLWNSGITCQKEKKRFWDCIHNVLTQLLISSCVLLRWLCWQSNASMRILLYALTWNKLWLTCHRSFCPLWSGKQLLLGTAKYLVVWSKEDSYGADILSLYTFSFYCPILCPPFIELCVHISNDVPEKQWYGSIYTAFCFLSLSSCSICYILWKL